MDDNEYLQDINIWVIMFYFHHSNMIGFFCIYWCDSDVILQKKYILPVIAYIMNSLELISEITYPIPIFGIDK